MTQKDENKKTKKHRSFRHRHGLHGLHPRLRQSARGKGSHTAGTSGIRVGLHFLRHGGNVFLLQERGVCGQGTQRTAVISDKFWPQPLPGQAMPEGKLSEAGIRKSIEGSLKRLQTDYIDIYTEHQMEDGSEEQVAYVMGLLIKEGKIRGWGQSSSSAAQVRKANAVTPLTAIQSEYSMMERKWEKDVLPLCRELGIGFVAFSPMGNGFLSGKYRPTDQFKGDDVRRVITRFSPENMEANQPLLDLVHRYADRKGCRAAQISLAWVLKGGDFIVPIPGMRSESRITENLGAADIELTDEEYAALTATLNKIEIHGDRDGKDIAKLGTVPDNVDR